MHPICINPSINELILDKRCVLLKHVLPVNVVSSVTMTMIL